VCALSIFPDFNRRFTTRAGGTFSNSAPIAEFEGQEAFDEFLSHRSERFDCKDLPTVTKVEGLSSYQSMHEYSMRFIGIIWRLFGITWLSVALVIAFFYSLSASLIFAISRQYVGRITAFLIAMLFVTSPSALTLSSTFRDFSKAPFILIVILACVILVARPRTTRYMMLTGLLSGIVAGIGLGFRADALMTPILFAVAIIFLMPSKAVTWKGKVALKIGVSGLFAAVFVLAALPILSAYQADSFLYTSFQRAEGVSGVFNTRLGLEPHFAGLGEPYADHFTFATILGYSARSSDKQFQSVSTTGENSQYSKQMGKWASEFYIDYVGLFPADVLARTIRATIRVATLPIEKKPDDLTRVPKLNASLTNVILKLSVSVLCVLIALVLMGMRNTRLALLFGLLLLFFGVVATIQFDPRHIFYMEPFFWITFFITLSFASTTFSSAIRARRIRFRSVREYRSSFAISPMFVVPVVLLLGAVCVLILLTISRQIQDRRLESYFERSLAARETAAHRVESLPDGDVMLLFDEPKYIRDLKQSQGTSTSNEPIPQWEYATRYLGVVFDSKRCEVTSGEVDLDYLVQPTWNTNNRLMFGSQFDINLDDSEDGRTILMFPAFFGNSVWFGGVRMSDSLQACLTEVFEIPPSEGTALTPYAELSPDWRDQRSHLGF